MHPECLMTLQVQIAKRTGHDERTGASTLSAPVTYSARVQAKPRLVLDDHGQQRVSNSTVLVEASASIDVGDQITLPDGSTPVIISVQPVYGHDGLESWAVYT